ncbi:protein of unknown function [Pseudomonas sp. JV241A]|nr:protein of unknown function [Pseudomonas sp. JV241A]
MDSGSEKIQFMASEVIVIITLYAKRY